MKLPRRRLLRLLSARSLCRRSRVCTGGHLSDAADSSDRRLFPPGGTADILARLTGQMLSERLGQQFVVENRGAAGNSIARRIRRAFARDGYTLLFIANPNSSTRCSTPI